MPILSVESKPEVLRFGGGTDADLRLQWQEFLLRIIADAFDLPPFYLGVERDVNRSTAEEYNDLAFRQAIVPTARLLAEYLTRDAIAKKLGWKDLEFVFADVETTDPLEEAQIQQILLQTGVLTVNEVQADAGVAGAARGRGSDLAGFEVRASSCRLSQTPHFSQRTREMGHPLLVMMHKQEMGHVDDRTGEYGDCDAGGGGASEPGGVLWCIDAGRCSFTAGSVGSEGTSGSADSGGRGSGIAVAAGDGTGLCAVV